MLQVVRLRWKALNFGIERVILKNERMTCYLVANSESAYYQSEIFGALLTYITNKPHRSRLGEKNGKRFISFSSVVSVETALQLFSEINQ